MKLKQHTKVILHLLCMLFFCMPIIQAQKTVDRIFTKSTTRTISLNDKNLSSKSTQFNQSIDLGEYGVYELSLEQTYLFSDDYVARRANKNDGIKIPLTFKGAIQGQPNTFVSLTTNKDFLSGFIDTGEEVIFFEPYKNFNSDAKKNELIIYYQRDVIDQGHTCTANHTDRQVTKIESQNDQFKSAADSYEVEMVLAADYGMYLKHGGNPLNHITSVLNNVRPHYDNEFNHPITFTVIDTYVATNPDMDLWTNTTRGDLLLTEFRESNISNFNYDLASLWVSRDLWALDADGNLVDIAGIAYPSAVCKSYKYNLMEDFTSSSASLRVAFAHEIGHNFSASHDAGGSGTIMAPAVNITSTWSTQSTNQINTFYPTATCLCVPFDAYITVNRPSTGQIYAPGDLLNIQWSDNITENVEIRLYTSTNSHYPIIASTSSDGSYSYTIPSYIPEGQYRVYIQSTTVTSINDYSGYFTIKPASSCTDGVKNGNETGIDCGGSCPPCKADLDITTCGTVSKSGNSVTVSGVVVKNIGTATAAQTTLGYYLSTNTTINSNDYLIGTDIVSSLPVNGTSTESISKNISNVSPKIPAGTYYVGMIADYNKTLSESNESNNTCYDSSPRFTVTYGCKDTNAHNYNPSATYANNTACQTCSDNVKNGDETSVDCGGTKCSPCGSITVTKPGTGDTYAIGNVLNIQWTDNITENVEIRMYRLGSVNSYYSVISSTASDGSHSFTIPSNRIPGQYRIYIKSKTNSSINDYSGYFTIEEASSCNDGVKNGNETGVDCGGSCPPCKPDLDITTCGTVSTSGTNITVSGVVVKNIGKASAASSTLGYYLSTNTIFDNNDYLIGTDAVSSLAVNFSNTEFITKNISTVTPQIPAGTYYVVMSADHNSTLSESNENNNTCYDGSPRFTVTYGCKDTNAHNYNPNATYANNTTCQTCSDGVKNGDETQTDCGGTKCSPCQVVSSCTDGIKNGNETGIDCGGSCPPCKADLDITTCGAVSISGNTVTVTGLVVENIGTATATTTTLGYYLSTNAIIESDDYLIGTDNVASLAVGSTNTESIGKNISTVTPPLPAGSYYVGMIADYNGRLSESNENNNTCFDGSPRFLVTYGCKDTNAHNYNPNATYADNSTCQTCSDGIKNGDETDIDCGGSSCLTCVPGGCETTIIVNAAGDEGLELMTLEINGQNVKEWTVTTNNQNYNFTYNGTVQSLRVHLSNHEYVAGQIDYNLNVDYIIVDGNTIQTNAPETYGESVKLTDIAGHCNKGTNFTIEKLFCKGFFEYSLPTYDCQEEGAAYYFITNRETGDRFYPESTANNAILLKADEGRNDDLVQWEKILTANGYFHLKNKATGMYIRPQDGNDAVNVWQVPTTDVGSYTQWTEINVNNTDFYHLQNRATGKFIRPLNDTPDAPILQQPSTWTGTWTQWTIEPVSAPKLETEDITFNLYPNPAEDYIRIDIQNIQENSAISIYDVSGKLLIQQTATSHTYDISVEDLKAGMYILRLDVGDGSTYAAKRFVVK